MTEEFEVDDEQPIEPPATYTWFWGITPEQADEEVRKIDAGECEPIQVIYMNRA